MNGVNLGGWLVIEEFLSPDMYKNTTTMKPYRSPRIPGGVNFQECAMFLRKDERHHLTCFRVPEFLSLVVFRRTLSQPANFFCNDCTLGGITALPQHLRRVSSPCPMRKHI